MALQTLWFCFTELNSFPSVMKQALWLKSDDQFCTEMLSLALVDECSRGVDPKIEFR